MKALPGDSQNIHTRITRISKFYRWVFVSVATKVYHCRISKNLYRCELRSNLAQWTLSWKFHAKCQFGPECERGLSSNFLTATVMRENVFLNTRFSTMIVFKHPQVTKKEPTMCLVRKHQKVIEWRWVSLILLSNAIRTVNTLCNPCNSLKVMTILCKFHMEISWRNWTLSD